MIDNTQVIEPARSQVRSHRAPRPIRDVTPWDVREWIMFLGCAGFLLALLLCCAGKIAGRI